MCYYTIGLVNNVSNILLLPGIVVHFDLPNEHLIDLEHITRYILDLILV